VNRGISAVQDGFGAGVVAGSLAATRPVLTGTDDRGWGAIGRGQEET
jgi:hypothetical protein